MNLLGLKLLVFLWQALLILPLSFQKMIGKLIGLILKLSNLKILDTLYLRQVLLGFGVIKKLIKILIMR